MRVSLNDEVRPSDCDLFSIKRVMIGVLIAVPKRCHETRTVTNVPIQIIHGQTKISPMLTQTWFEDTQ
jgi:hypothetical protein